MIDNHMIMSGKPLPKDELWQRNLCESMSGFKLLSSVFWNRELKGTNDLKVQSLFVRWIEYDALRDMKEDLEAGIILMSKEELFDLGIKLEKSQKVPENMKDWFKYKKQEVLKKLPSEAKNINKTNIPEPWKTLLWAYFFTRRYKLMKTQYPLNDEEINLGQNSEMS